MATVLTINSVAVSVPRDYVIDRFIPYVKGGIPSLAISARGGPLVGLPDPVLGKTCGLTIGGTTRFVGDFVSMDPPFQSGIGWVRKYQALGLRNRGDWFPHTDSNSLTDNSSYNLSADNQQADYLASRAGRTVGQILTDVLTMTTNAAKLAAFGFVIGSATTTDLAALVLIPPAPVYFGGEKFLQAVEAMLATWAPNITLWVQPDGTLRFLDLRTFTPTTLTMGTDPILPSPLSRDVSACFSQVEVRGSPIAEPILFELSLGTLTEAPFAHDGLTVSAAKAAWTPSDWTQPGLANSTAIGVGSYDRGTLTCSSTTTVVCTSSNVLATFPIDYWDYTSTGRHGVMMMQFSSGTLVTNFAARATVANTAMTAGGTATFTLDRPLPNLLFDTYTVSGTTKDASVVWCVYGLPSWAGPLVQKQTTFPFAFHTSSGLAETTTSSPTGWLLYSNSGNPPYQEYATPVTVDPASGTIRFAYPTFLTVGQHVPTDVRAVVPINTGANTAWAPSSSTHAGTCHTVEGISRPLIVTVPAWRDPANQAAMDAFAADLLDSVKDTVNEGSVQYLGLYTPALSMGIALNIAGTGYTTGWEAGTIPAVAVVEVQIEWPLTGPVSHITTMRCSSRRSHLDASGFMHPDRTGITWDFGSVDSREFGLGGVQYSSAPIQVALTPASGLAPPEAAPAAGLAAPSGLASPEEMAGPNDNFDRSGMNQRGMI